MKEKDIYLTPEEMNYLVKGTIHWEDVKGRVDAPPRKPIESRGRKSSEVVRDKDPILPQSEQDVKQPFLEGNNVYWILAGVGILTLGTWIYFVFAI